MTTITADSADDDPFRARARLLHGSSSPSENWDDDFEFQVGAATHPQDRGSDAMNAPLRLESALEQEESWDDAYGDDNTHKPPATVAPKVDDDGDEDWDSSDNELEAPHLPSREHRNDRTRELNLEEEDKTVTARPTSYRPPPLPLPIPPLPSTHLFDAHTVLPPSTTSPTLSTFSIPLSSTTRDHASIYSQDPLVPASNSSAPHLLIMRSYPHAAGSTPPRKGRRLRKKSRPPEADIFELEDREVDAAPTSVPAPVPAPQLTVPIPTTPPHAPQAMLDSPPHSSQPSAPPTPSPSLLTRISSLKRWARRSVGPDDPALSGWRRGRSSTGPSEVKSPYGLNDPVARDRKLSTGPEGITSVDEELEVDPRAASPTPAPGSRIRRGRGDSASGQKSGWFFRAGGAAGAERNEANPTARPPELTPKRGNALGLRLRNVDNAQTEEDGNEAGIILTPRKTKAKLIPVLKAGTSPGPPKQVEPKSPTRPSKRPSSRGDTENQSGPGSRPMSLVFPHHGNASVGRDAGMPLSVSVSAGATLPVPSVTEGREKDSKIHQESRDKQSGMRGLVNGVRRLSLVGSGHGHKRPKSIGSESGVADAVRNEAATRQAEHQPGNGLLPPAELESPSSEPHARRRSIPWADFNPPTGDSSRAVSPTIPTFRTSPVTLRAHGQQSQDQASLSSSASSLLGGSLAKSLGYASPTKFGQSAATPVAVQTSPADTVATSHSTTASGDQTGQHLPPPSQTFTQSPPSGSPVQSASLGRCMSSPSHSAALRRNSLGDLKTSTNVDHKPQLPPLGELKIPARISRAQQGLRRDLGMVREFAGCVEQLKQLQVTYTVLVAEIRATCEASPTSLASAPVQFHLPSRPPSQTGIAKKGLTTNSSPAIQNVYQTVSLNSPTQPHSLRSISRTSHEISREIARLEHEYGIWWECAELLVELGGGSGMTASTVSNPNLAYTPAEERVNHVGSTEQLSTLKSSAAHMSSISEPGSLFEHALPAAASVKGPPQASPPHPSQWRASTGRHDLSARQLKLLKDMLNTPDPASLVYAKDPYGYGTVYPHPYSSAEAQPWAAWNPSALTLPSEESSADPHVNGASVAEEGKVRIKEKKRRSSRLGMLGLREILRGLKRGTPVEGKFDAGGEHQQEQQGSESSMRYGAEDDHYNRLRSPWHQHDEHHAARQSTGPDVVVAMNRPSSRIPPKSPRRPSLASIFRLGHKTAKNTGANGRSKEPASNGTSTTEDERESGPTPALVGEYSDWERMSRSDLDLKTVGSGTATVRGKNTKVQAFHPIPNPYHSYPDPNNMTPKKAAMASQTSLREISPRLTTSPIPPRHPPFAAEDGNKLHKQNSKHPRSAREKERTSSWSQAHPSPGPQSRNTKAVMSGTVRSAPPSDLSDILDHKLVLTPETIKPLLEYAKEVSTRLTECINEVQTILGAGASTKSS